MLELTNLKSSNKDLCQKELDNINGGSLLGIGLKVGANLLGKYTGNKVADRLGDGGSLLNPGGLSDGTLSGARQRGAID